MTPARSKDEPNNLVELDFLVKNSALFKPVKALERITPFLASGWG
jgi:hypothetical protein